MDPRSVILALLCVVSVSCLTSREEEGLYINEWAVKVTGGERVARGVASDHGYEFDGQIGKLPDTYAFVRKHHSPRSRRSADELNALLEEDERVLWAEQQKIIVHEKKDVDIVPPDETGDNRAIPFNDPLWPLQWYLYNDGQRGALPGMDMNLMPAWKLGYTGKGVVVTIVDDGVDKSHPDLKDNFDMYASYDFNDRSKKNNPTPDYSKPAHEVRHGTRCAGEVAAAANNSVCGVGVAYEASIGGIRLLDGPATDRLTADAIQFNNSHVDIYSCCWGPVDDGRRFDMPHRLTREALEEGAKSGRNGKGSIFVWASGNGGSYDDHCGADGYVGDIHTIAISSINDHGRQSYFVESCPANMAVTLSGGPKDIGEVRDGSFTWNLVTTTDLYGNCTTGFVGTSSAAPLASGLFALILQANPQLTWRDLQYIITEGCMIPQPYDAGWTINGAGLHVHHAFGFGVLDAGRMVELALTWDLVAEQRVCQIDPIFPELSVRQGSSSNVTLSVRCPGLRSMEHVQAHISFQAPRRGDVSLTLFSPFGTPSRLLAPRTYDSSQEGLMDWPFMSVHNWGEDPTGEWTLQFSYDPTPNAAVDPEDEVLQLNPRLQTFIASLDSWAMTIYGLEEPRVIQEEEDGHHDDDEEAEGEGEVEPDVYPEDAGKGDFGTIVKIYNQEQMESEEINIHPNDIVEGVPLPPNFAHNFDKSTGLIETGSFDGHIRDRFGGIIKLVGFAKRMESGDEILNYLVSLDDRSLEMLERDFELDHMMDRLLEKEVVEEDTEVEGEKRGGIVSRYDENDLQYSNRYGTKGQLYSKKSDLGLEKKGPKGIRDQKDEMTKVESNSGKRDEISNTDIVQLLRSLDKETLTLLLKELVRLDLKESDQIISNERKGSKQIGIKKAPKNDYPDAAKKGDDMTLEIQKKKDELLEIQKKQDDSQDLLERTRVMSDQRLYEMVKALNEYLKNS